MRSSLEIRGGTAVLPDRLIEDARIVVEDGVIVEVGSNATTAGKSPGAHLSGAGCWILPGAIDLHSDGLEKQIRPRPRAEMPLEHVIQSYDRLLPATGITTTFHAVKFSTDVSRERTLNDAQEVASALQRFQESAEHLVDHFILHRMDVRTAGAWQALSPHLFAAEFPYVSVDDNQPGQGQFRDMEHYGRMLRERLEGLDVSVEEYLAERRSVDTAGVAIKENLRALQAARCQHPIRIASHDDDTVEQVRHRREIGCDIAEFPVTKEAAFEAAALGMPIVGGAPNVLRGKSLYNNLSFRELLPTGTVSALCSDYYPWSMWWTIFDLARENILPIWDLVNLATGGPAAAIGLSGDRGALVPGLRADIVMIRLVDGVPNVEATFVGGRPVYAATLERWGAAERPE